MRKIVERVADLVLGPGAQCGVRVVNEVVVRAIVRAVFRGMAPKYVLRTYPTAHGERYSYDVTVPGVEIGILRMREACAVPALKKSIATEEGKEDLCRYLFSICAFMPEERGAILHAILSSPSSPAYVLREAVLNMCSFIDGVSRRAGNVSGERGIKWDEIYKTCSRNLIATLSEMSTVSLVKVAYAVYTSEVCAGITRRKEDLLGLLERGSVGSEAAPDVAAKLRLLSNFNPGLMGHYEIRRAESGGVIRYDSLALERSLKNDGEWPHAVNHKVSAQIRKSAEVAGEKLLLISMLLNCEIGITTDNVGAVLFNTGRVGYSYRTHASFPLLKDVSSSSDLRDGLLSSREGEELVDLMLESARVRHRCSYGVDYEVLAEEVRRLSEDAEEGEMLMSGVVEGICEGLCRQGVDSAAVLECAKEIALLLSQRLKFLRAFVDHPQYKNLGEFIMTSSVLDTSVDFERHLRRRAKEKSLKEEQDIVRRADGSCLNKALGAYGTLLIVCAVLCVIYALYTYMRHGSGAVMFGGIGDVLGVAVSMQAVFVFAFVTAALGFLCLSLACINMRRGTAVEVAEEEVKMSGPKRMGMHIIGADDMKTVDAVGCVGNALVTGRVEGSGSEGVVEGECVDISQSGGGVRYECSGVSR